MLCTCKPHAYDRQSFSNHSSNFFIKFPCFPRVCHLTLVSCSKVAPKSNVASYESYNPIIHILSSKLSRSNPLMRYSTYNLPFPFLVIFQQYPSSTQLKNINPTHLLSLSSFLVLLFSCLMFLGCT